MYKWGHTIISKFEKPPFTLAFLLRSQTPPPHAMLDRRVYPDFVLDDVKQTRIFEASHLGLAASSSAAVASTPGAVDVELPLTCEPVEVHLEKHFVRFIAKSDAANFRQPPLRPLTLTRPEDRFPIDPLPSSWSTVLPAAAAAAAVSAEELALNQKSAAAAAVGGAPVRTISDEVRIGIDDDVNEDFFSKTRVVLFSSLSVCYSLSFTVIRVFLCTRVLVCVTA